MAALLPLLVAWASLAGLAVGQWVAANSTGGADNTGRLCGELELCTSSNYTWAPVAAAARGPGEACALLQQKGLKTLRLFGDSFGARPPVPGPSTSFGDFCLSGRGIGGIKQGFVTVAPLLLQASTDKICEEGMHDVH